MKTKIKQKNIPRGWEEKQFDDCVVLPTKLKGIKKSDYKPSGEYPIFDQGQSYISGYTDKDDFLNDNFPVILFGDHTRIVKLIKSPFVLGADGTKIFWTNKGVDISFFFYSLLNTEIPNTGYNRHFKFLKEKNILMPKDTKEQQKIAEILGKVDEDITKTQEVIETTEKLKKGLMQQLFVPKKNWEKEELKKVADIVMGQSPNSANYNEINDGIPLIQGNADIKDRRSIKRFSTSETTKKINEGDIIMTVRAPVGYVATASFDSCIGRGVCGIQPKKIEKKYLYYFLINKEIEFNKKAQGSTFTAINSDEIKKIKVIFPKNIKEQNKIAEILSAVDEKISVNKKLKEKLTQLKKGLMQDLLSGKVRVTV